ncbi:transglycosylase domain-containing protein [Altererythrobacter sp. TH136]|uniref:transglycosylase domain-containing protein n=1 Tax=Altererythrobacter sp. TH136 TaxID=2067415 RepID=UPI00116367A3|nr:transglycosylase domain-containing protein [Altererythrobacter sp. TH136]QDM41599.1 penicillin-binding protein [Altererythrobacter sp. TH136]
MAFFRSRPKPAPEPAPHAGYFALHEAYGDDTPVSDKFDDWDRRLGTTKPDTAHRLWFGRRRSWWIVRAIAALIALFIVIVAWLAVTAPLSKSLQPIAPPELTLLANDGTPIARNGAVIGKPVEVAQLPDHVVEAFMAIEDRRFYSHWGIDPRGMARAAWTGYGGGSTITQQLAKFTFLTPEQTLTRKAREMLIAFWLEAWLTKDEILERYLSNAYFGDNVYGLRAASLHYFYRQPERLKPDQAAMLAGLVQAPSRYAPTKHYERAARRMKLVVGSMEDAGYITAAEARAMRPPRLDVRPNKALPTGTYFADWALPQGRQLAEAGYGGQTLTTTLDSRLQAIARRATQRVPGKAQVALVAMRPNGEVVAMIGGKDYARSPFNRATQARRQPGSTFKLFVWLAALRSGMSPDDMIDNREITTGSYRPKNAGGNYSASITLEDAFARSSNVAAVRLLKTVGSENVIATARDLGVQAPLAQGDPSLALGTSTMTLLELTSAYAGVAANQFPVRPHAFATPKQGWLAKAWEWSRHESLSGRTHRDIEQMMRAAVSRGTGRAAALSVPAFGKTGTSQDYRDALFVGYAGDLVVGVWVGNDDNTPLNGVTGGSIPARIWRDFMAQALGKSAPRPAPAPGASEDPGTPVEPMDVPGPDAIPTAEFPIDDRSRVRIGGEGVTVTTDIEGLPVDVRLDRDGLRVQPAPTPTPSAPPAPGGP